MREQIVIQLAPPKPLPPGVTTCPRCGGTGKNADGGCMISQTEVRVFSASDCGLCQGKRLVRIEPYEEGE